MLAVVIGAVVIGGAFLLTQKPSADNLPSPIVPGRTTPTDIASSGRVLGDPNAPVTIDLYSDFRCTGCFAFAMEIEPDVVKNYVATGKAKLVYHDFIVIDRGGNTESRDAANAACAPPTRASSGSSMTGSSPISPRARLRDTSLSTGSSTWAGAPA